MSPTAKPDVASIAAGNAPSWEEAQMVLAHVRDLVVLVRRDRTVLYANAAAQRALCRADALRLSRCRIAAASRSDAYRFERTIDAVCSAGDGSVEILVIRRSDSPPLVLSARCLGERKDEVVLLLASDPCVESSLVLDSLRQCFGLTASEAQVAAAVAAGATPSQIAGERGVQVNTIRSQIKAIAAKLGCARQSQISAIVRAAPLARSGPL